MKRMLVVVLISLCSVAAYAVDDISLQALFKDKAIFLIDGVRRVLSVGEKSREGVRLIAADPSTEQAEVSIDGKRKIIKLSMVMAGFASAKQTGVTLWASTGGHFHADGAINGLPVRFLIDTGATTVALSGDEATRLGIDYRKFGRLGYANTASGVVRAYALKLDKVELGPIVLYNVDAGVIEGSYPLEALLGMSFLGRLDMKREGNRMELTPQ